MSDMKVYALGDVDGSLSLILNKWDFDLCLEVLHFQKILYHESNQ